MHARQPLIALATSAEHHDLAWDDRSLLAALQARGASAVSVIWSAEAQWDVPYAAVVVRSCWDYHRRLEEFLAWVHRLEARGTLVLNAPPLLRWNVRKSYLLELAAEGIPSVPTLLGDAGDLPGLFAHVEALADVTPTWRTVILKPEVSASAFCTVRLTRDARRGFALDRLDALPAGRVLVQPFQPSIETDGELSLAFIDGTYSHTVLKKAAPGDFRVQSEYGGTAIAVEPPTAARHRAEEVLRALRRRHTLGAADPLYARVDLLAADEHLLMELELIEPALFLACHPQAADRLAAAILERIRHEG